MAPGDDPDVVFDLLPKPYRYVAEVIEEVLEALGDQINEIERKRRLEEYEVSLPMVGPSVSQALEDEVSCVASNPDDSNLMALGTLLGQILVFDGMDDYLRHTTPFRNEAVCSLTMIHSGAYCLHPNPEQEELHTVPQDKLVVAGTASFNIYIYDIRHEFKGLALTPLCCVEVECPSSKEAHGMAKDQGRSDGQNEPQTRAPRSIAQLRARGALGALALSVLLPNGVCHVYLCPLGTPEPPKRRMNKKDTLLSTTIQEEQDEEQQEQGEGQTKEGLEFQAVETIRSPTYRIQMHDMVPSPALSGSEMDSWLLESFGSISKERNSACASTVLVHCLLASKESNVIKYVALDTPQPANGAAAETAAAAVQKLRPFVFGEMQARSAETATQHSEWRWLLTAKTTAVAAARSGVRFAVGMESGAVALFSAVPCPTLRAMLPAHYAAVAGMAFCGSDKFISVGRDSYVHMYSADGNYLCLRFLLSPPPSAPPAAGIVVSSVMALALVYDDAGNQRLIDIASGQKIAKVDIPLGQKPGWVNAEVQPPQRVLVCSEGVGILRTHVLRPRVSTMPSSNDGEVDDKVECCMEQHLHYFHHHQLPGRMRDVTSKEIELDQSSSGTGVHSSSAIRDARSSVTSRARAVKRHGTGTSVSREVLHSRSAAPPCSDSIASIATQPAQLTAANLRKASGAGESPAILNAAAGGGARLVTEHWQARVKAYCRHERASKAIRKQRAQKAIGQARSTLESASDTLIVMA
mmetsp:Transcript_124144/g.241907  ORF Transcript_124144/g.241907 Transcript_124144/m.241907 type:complete len:751 (-) Transcript_124144:62-2314(-)